MAVTVIINWHNPDPNTIWNQLAGRLGRPPTQREAADEVRRILRNASMTEQSRGQESSR